MKERLRQLFEKYQELSSQLHSPEIASDYQKAAEIHKELKKIEPYAEKYQLMDNLSNQAKELREIIRNEDDAELQEIARQELREIEERLKHLENEVKQMLLIGDEENNRDAILEIRAGTGGEEAALFAADLFRMYSRFAENKGLKVEILSHHESELGGFKEIICAIRGPGAYGLLRHESGVHRVQRIPVTESGGRIHTSTATVAVLPEAEEVEVKINPSDLKIETFRASGPGGQHVNVTDSAVRITHIPTGIVVTCQDERSQHKNRARAMSILRAKLLQMRKEEQKKKIDSLRRSQVGTGERSEKIRTYNFPQNRVTDHRVNLTLKQLDRVMDGELDTIIDALTLWEAEKASEEL